MLDGVTVGVLAIGAELPPLPPPPPQAARVKAIDKMLKRAIVFDGDVEEFCLFICVRP